MTEDDNQSPVVPPESERPAEVVANDVADTAQELGSTAAEAVTSIEAKNEDSPADQPTQKQKDEWDEQRGFHQSLFEERAQTRNDNRPVSGLLRKTVEGEELSPMDVAHEEALAMNKHIDNLIGSRGSYMSGKLKNRTDAVEHLEEYSTYGEKFFPPDERWRVGDWKEKLLDKDKQYWPNQQQIEERAQKISEAVITMLQAGDIVGAADKYDDLYTAGGGAYYPEGKEALDKLVRPVVTQLADSLFVSRNSIAIGELLGAPLANLIYSENLSTPREQRQTPEMIGLAKQKAIEFVNQIAREPETVKNKSNGTPAYLNDSHDFAGYARAFTLSRLFERMQRMGIVSVDELVAAPEVRNAAMGQVLKELETTEKSDMFHIFYEPASLAPYKRLGLIAEGEFESKPAVIEEVRRLTLAEIQESDWKLRYQSMGESFLERINKLAANSTLNPKEVVVSKEGQEAFYGFVGNALGTLDEWLKAKPRAKDPRIYGDEGEQRGPKAALELWKHYADKINVITALMKEGSVELKLPEDVVEKWQDVTKRLVSVADAQARSMNEAADAQFQSVTRPLVSIEDNFGIAA